MKAHAIVHLRINRRGPLNDREVHGYLEFEDESRSIPFVSKRQGIEVVRIFQDLCINSQEAERLIDLIVVSKLPNSRLEAEQESNHQEYDLFDNFLRQALIGN